MDVRTVEVVSLVSERQYNDLLDFMRTNAELMDEDLITTFNFEGKKEFSIQKNNDHSKIMLKKGMIADDELADIQVKGDIESFETMLAIFKELGYEPAVKWFKKRHQYKWEDIDVTIDFNRGYGYVVGLSIKAQADKKDIAQHKLKEKLRSLGLKESSRIIMKEKADYYRDNWKDLV